MILCHCNFFSQTLKNHVDINLLLPSMPDNATLSTPLSEVYAPAPRYPLLTLLHGALDDYSCWLRHTSIERYAEQHGIAVAMPSGQNGFYSNALSGMNYFDFITEELPLFLYKNFHVSNEKSSNYIAGPSMGGYGASKCALSKPEKYAAFANLSGAVSPGELEPKMKAMGFDFFRYDLIFGGSDKVGGSKDDLYLLAQNLHSSLHKPRAFTYCALEDTANHQMNLRLHNTLTQAGFNSSFIDGPGGHDWPYWDGCIKHFLEQIDN